MGLPEKFEECPNCGLADHWNYDAQKCSNSNCDLIEFIGIECLGNIKIRFPENFEFSEEDWKDLHFTLFKFKKRVLKRHQLG